MKVNVLRQQRGNARGHNSVGVVPSARRGFALIDVIIGALMLGAGLAVIISLSSRSLASQTEGEKRMIAAWLADELLSMVIVEGPEEYSHRYDLAGEFFEPFDEFSYHVDIQDNGPGMAYTVIATIGWEVGMNRTQEIAIEAAIAQRRGDPDQPREPRDWVDREKRHYERLFGKDEEEEAQSKAIQRLPTNQPNPTRGGNTDRNARNEDSGARGGARDGR